MSQTWSSKILGKFSLEKLEKFGKSSLSYFFSYKD